MHSDILRCFIPLTLRENLISEYVNRPQKIGEPLALYAELVKSFAQVLNCSYSESELVEIITMGINVEDRSKLVLVGPILTFKDLERACIHCQNVGYCNYIRDKSYVRSNFKQTGIRPNENKKCYNCGRAGHLAKQCYRKSNQQKN